MSNTFGFGTDTGGFSDTVHDHILKEVISTLRAGLVALPKGSVVPATIVSQSGENFVLRSTEYPDLQDGVQSDLSEGVAPSALKLGIDTNDWTVTQTGGRTVVTDIAALQSPHDLRTIAADKIARLAASNFDSIARAAIDIGADDLGDTGSPLGTADLLDAVAELQTRNIEPVPGAGYYCLLHPKALRGLTGEDALNGYIDVTASANAGMLTKGAVGQYRGVTFLTSTKFEADSSVYPVYFMGAASMAAGDVGSLSFHTWSAAGPGNELQQLMGVGYKSIFGAKVLAFSEEADGAGANSAVTERVLRIGVLTGVGS